MNEAPRPHPEDAGTIGRMELMISTLLRVGILVSLSLVAAGLTITFVHHPEYATSAAELPKLTTDVYAFPTTISSLFNGVASGEGRSMVLLGVFCLFLTPVLRVATSVVAFSIERDWIYTLFTSIVLMFLILSLILGRTG